MSVLLNAYPGDAVVESFIVILLTVSLVSFATLVACRWLKHNPTLRHCVLLSALLCVLLSPLTALVFAWSDTAIFSIRLPVESTANSSPTTDASPSDANRKTVDSPSELSDDPLGEPRAVASTIEHKVLPENNKTDRSAGKSEIRSENAVTKTEVDAGMINVSQSAVTTFTVVDRLRIASLVALIIWGIGSFVPLIGTVRNWGRWRAVRRSSRPIDDARVVDLLADVRRNLNIAKLPEIRSSSQIDTPIVIGLWRPLVVLPTRSLQAVSATQMRDALVHEIAHVLRHDHFVLLLQTIARAMFWPNPLISLLNRQLDCAREEVCDNYVLANRNPIEYGETLLRFAEMAKNSRPLPGSIGMLQSRGKLEDRISAILDDRRNTMIRPNRFVASAILATLVVMCAIACGSRFVTAQAEQPRAANDRPVPEDKPAAKVVKQPNNKRQSFKATRKNNLVRISPLDLSFQLPQQWIGLNKKFHHNLHFTEKELAAVKSGDDVDWDFEYATVVNTVLPFERCVLHAGDDGWGRANAVSFADLQMRVYILDETLEKIETKVVTDGTQAVRTLFTPRRVALRDSGGRKAGYRPKLPKDADKTPKDLKVPVKRSNRDQWRQVALSYDLSYGDYGAKASIDFRLRRIGDRTVAVVFMHTNANKQAPTIKAILGTFVAAKKQDRAENRGTVKKEEQSYKATRKNKQVQISPLDISFQLPQKWIGWNEKFHNNLHFTEKELAAVQSGGDWGVDGKGSQNWDRDFAMVVNGVLPFERCTLHAGGDGWGPGKTYTDIQMRVYILDEAVEKVEAKVAATGAQAVRTIFTPRRVAWRGRGGRPANYRPTLPKDPDQPPKDMKVPIKRSTQDGWRQVALSYILDYGDFDMSFSVDFRLRRFRDKTVAVVLMYRDLYEFPENSPYRSTELPRQKKTIEAILASFTVAKKKDRAENRGVVKDGLAAYIWMDQRRFKIGEPIPLMYGITNVGTDRATVWKPSAPVDKGNRSWLTVTGSGGKDFPFPINRTWENRSPKDKIKLYQHQIRGEMIPDIASTYRLREPGKYKVRYHYENDQLISNEVEFEIVKK